MFLCNFHNARLLQIQIVFKMNGRSGKATNLQLNKLLNYIFAKIIFYSLKFYTFIFNTFISQNELFPFFVIKRMVFLVQICYDFCSVPFNCLRGYCFAKDHIFEVEFSIAFHLLFLPSTYS